MSELSERSTLTVTRETLVKWGEHVRKNAVAAAYSITLDEVEKRNAERKAAEDVRANKRNFNRMLMLFGALLIGLVVSYVLSHPAQMSNISGIDPNVFKTLAPYAFVITILFDSGLALYSYIKRY